MRAADIDNLISMGTVGHNHLLGTAQKCFGLVEVGGADASRYLEMGIRLLCMAWVEFPLNGPLSAQLVSLSQKSPLVSRFLDPRVLGVVERVARYGQAPDDEEANRLFAQSRGEDLDTRFDVLASGAGPLAVARQAVMLQSMLSRQEWLEAFVSGPVAQADQELAEVLLPDILLASRRYEQAVPACEKLVALLGLPAAGFRLGTALAGSGDAEGAKAVLGQVLVENPDHVSALLALDRIAFPPCGDVRLPGKCVVSIYSYNKAAELDRTLESVLVSDLGPAVGDVRVRVLINGSEDDSLQVAEGHRDRFGDRLEVVALPVNVGAPAARNWLIEAACRDGAEWLAFLDDDVLVPSGWLRKLAAGTEAFPDAGVWGCRVADVVSPNLTQHADGFLLDRESAAQQGETIVSFEPCVQSLVPDFMAHGRLCATVTGCCHLFRTKDISAGQGFDLAFSPSQFDDLDRDLRALLKGKPAAYLGNLTVTHLRPDFHFLPLSESAQAISANHRSLLGVRHESQLDELLAVQTGFVAADLAARRARLREAGLLS